MTTSVILPSVTASDILASLPRSLWYLLVPPPPPELAGSFFSQHAARFDGSENVSAHEIIRLPRLACAQRVSNGSRQAGAFGLVPRIGPVPAAGLFHFPEAGDSKTAIRETKPRDQEAGVTRQESAAQAHHRNLHF